MISERAAFGLNKIRDKVMAQAECWEIAATNVGSLHELCYEAVREAQGVPVVAGVDISTPHRYAHDMLELVIAKGEDVWKHLGKMGTKEPQVSPHDAWLKGDYLGRGRNGNNYPDLCPLPTIQSH